jgi:hypothetical protein
MDGRTATGVAIAVTLIGIAAFFVLDGVAAGIALLLAGVLLVVIGVVGWQERAPVGATAGAPTAAATSSVAHEPRAMHAEAVPDPSVEDGPRSAWWSHVAEDADETRDVASGIPADETQATDGTAEPVSEDAPAPQRQVAEVEAVADPLGRRRTNSVLDADRAEGATSGTDRPEPEPTMQVLDDASGLDHVHDEPVLGHSDLVAHVRDHHAEIPTDGSTIQLRLLHERAHGAPHELPVDLKTS